MRALQKGFPDKMAECVAIFFHITNLFSYPFVFFFGDLDDYYTYELARDVLYYESTF